MRKINFIRKLLTLFNGEPPELTPEQKQLLEQIKVAVARYNENEITYYSEWQGYLYHWVTAGGKDISRQIFDPTNVHKNLEILEKLSHLREIERGVKKYEDGIDDLMIKYKSAE